MVDIVRPIYGEAWASSGEKLSPTEIKVQSGWVQEMMPYQWENFLQNRQDTTLLYLLQKGVPEWSVDQEYIGNKSIVTHNGYTYQAKSTNTGNLPTDSVYWKRTSPNVTDSGIVTLGSGGTGATNATDARTNLGLGTAATISADTIVFKSVTGNAPAADKWTSSISLSLSGGATGNTSLDGSGNATINVSGLNASSISSGTVPSSALTNATLKTSPVGSTILAAGLTSERDLSPLEGYTRWNKTTKVVEVFNGTSWTVNTSQSEAYLLNRANHTGTQPITSISGLESQTSAEVVAAIAMAQTFTAVPATFQAWEIVVTQPHLRKMVWSSASNKYVRAPWHQPGVYFYAHDPLGKITHGIQVRTDVTYNTADHPDLAEYLGVVGPTFVLPGDGRARVLRGADLGAGVDTALVDGYVHGDAGRNLTGSIGAPIDSGVNGFAAKTPSGAKFFLPGNPSGYVAEQANVDASRQWPIANEFRVKSLVARLYITR